MLGLRPVIGLRPKAKPCSLLRSYWPCSHSLALQRLTGPVRASNDIPQGHNSGQEAVERNRIFGSTTPPAPRRKLFRKPSAAEDVWGNLLYQYYNWRQDTTSDLQLFIVAFILLVTTASLIKTVLIESQLAPGALELWRNLYQVIVLSFGQDFPDPFGSSTVQQVFSVGVAGVGLASFALVLALVEQVVLEIIDENVRRGSTVYEYGHILVLGWCSGQRDFEVVSKILFQLCKAYRNDGGTTVVVMTQRPKLEMEATFRNLLPVGQRHGTQFVFRTGSPLVPGELQSVSATTAAAIIVVADQSRAPDEADAQSLRCAILLDELEPPKPKSMERHGARPPAPQVPAPPPASGHIVVELLTSNAIPMLSYSCSSRAVGVPTAQFNARRLAKLLKQPVVSMLSQQLMSFETPSSLYVQDFPSLVGVRFCDAAFRFEDSILLGVVKGRDFNNSRTTINPPPWHRIAPDEALILVRPTSESARTFRPNPTGCAEDVDMGAWPHSAALPQPAPAALPVAPQQQLEPPFPTTTSPASGHIGGRAFPPRTPSFAVLDPAAPPSSAAAAAAAASWSPSSLAMPLATMSSDSEAEGAAAAGGSESASDAYYGTAWHDFVHNASQSWDEAYDTAQQQQQPTLAELPCAGHDKYDTWAAVPGARPRSHEAPAGEGSRVSDGGSTVHSPVASWDGVSLQLPALGPGGAQQAQQQEGAALQAEARAQAQAQLLHAEAQQEQAQALLLQAEALVQERLTRSASCESLEDALPAAGAAGGHAGNGTGELGAATPATAGVQRAGPIVAAARVQQSGPGAQQPAYAIGYGFGGVDNDAGDASELEPPPTYGWRARGSDSDAELGGGTGSTRDSWRATAGDKTASSREARARALRGMTPMAWPPPPAMAAGPACSLSAEPTAWPPSSSGVGGTFTELGGAAQRASVASLLASASSALASTSPGGSAADLSSTLQFMVPPEYLTTDCAAERVLLCGWGDPRFMTALLHELDHGSSALPAGSEVVMLNNHDVDKTLARALKGVPLTRIRVHHVKADPLQRHEIANAIDITQFQAALVLCDQKWVDPDMDSSNGADSLRPHDMLRLDALVMMVQLNVRKLLEDAERPTINIICQKLATEGLTRFEDRHRLPMGISVNFASYAAKMLAQVAYNPAMLMPYASYSEGGDFGIADASELAAPGERVTFWQLMRRAQDTQQVLLGYYKLPLSVDTPVEMVINPRGSARATPRVWNRGDNLVKFIMLRAHQDTQGSQRHRHSDHNLDSRTSYDDSDLIHEPRNPAVWVTARAQQQQQQSTASGTGSVNDSSIMSVDMEDLWGA